MRAAANQDTGKRSRAPANHTTDAPENVNVWVGQPAADGEGSV